MEDVKKMVEEVVSSASAMIGRTLSATISMNEIVVMDGDRTVATAILGGKQGRIRKHLEKAVRSYLATPEIRATEPEAHVEETSDTETHEVAEKDPVIETKIWYDLDTVVPVSEVPVSEYPVAVAPVAVAPVSIEPVAEATTDFQSGIWDALDTVVPVSEAPVAESPVSEAPVAESPVSEAPVAVAPVAVEPVAVAPVSVAHAAVDHKANKAHKAKANNAKDHKANKANKDHNTSQPWEESLRRAFARAAEIPRKILWRVSSEEGMQPIDLRLEVDSVGVYMLAGDEAISALSRDLPSYQLVKRLADNAWTFARAAEQRSKFRRKAREEAEMIRSAPSDVGVDAAAAAEIRAAVTKAVTQANASLAGLGDVCRHLYGTPSGGSLEASGFAGGVVVSINGAVAFAVAFPKVSATRPLKAVVEFARIHIGAVAQHHMTYLREAASRLERMSELRGLAAAQDAINEQKRKFA